LKAAKMRPTQGYIVTASGRLMYPLAPTPDQIHLEDIAAQLSKSSRWTGATTGDEVYSIAQHGLLVSFEVEIAGAGYMAALDGLHHDDSEAYIADISRPVKYDQTSPEFGRIYRRNEKRLMRAIYQKFGIPFVGDNHHPAVKDADNRMLITEARDVMPMPLDGYGVYEFDMADAYERPIEIMSSRYARQMFTARHNYLMAKITEEREVAA
jgi:hypothetical protein